MPDFSDGRAIEDPCSLDSSGRGMRSLSRLKASADAPADLEKALQKLDAQLKKDDGHE